MDNNRQKIVQEMDCVVSPKAGKPVLDTNLEHEAGQPGDGARRGAVIANCCLRVYRLSARALASEVRWDACLMADGQMWKAVRWVPLA